MESTKLSTSEQLKAINRIMSSGQMKTREVLSFGKYKGMSLSDVPLDYLEWLSNNSDNDGLVDKIEIEIHRRKR